MAAEVTERKAGTFSPRQSCRWKSHAMGPLSLDPAALKGKDAPCSTGGERTGCQMRRISFGLGVIALAVLSIAAPASAARGQVAHFRSQGAFAEAFWATSDGGTYINAGMQKREGPGVVVLQSTTDPDTGNFTNTEAKGPATLTIDQAGLTTASVSATGLQGTTCTFDVNGNQIGDCTTTTVDVSVTWTGQGPIARLVSNEHFKAGSFSGTTHFQGTSRDATVTAAVAGLPAALGDFQFGNMAITKASETTVCIGNHC